MHASWTACFPENYQVPRLIVLVLILEAEDQSSSPGFVFCLPDAVFYLQIVVLKYSILSRKFARVWPVRK